MESARFYDVLIMRLIARDAGVIHENPFSLDGISISSDRASGIGLPCPRFADIRCRQGLW